METVLEIVGALERLNMTPEVLEVCLNIDLTTDYIMNYLLLDGSPASLY